MKRSLFIVFLFLEILVVCCIEHSDKKTGRDGTSFVPPLNNERFRLFDLNWRFYKGEQAGAEAIGFDDSQWRKVDLPHDWSIEDLPNQKEGEIVGPFDKNSIGLFYTGYTAGGSGWYRKSFVTDETAQDREFSVCFDGVYMESDVWLNGHHLGSHKHGYTPFFFKLNDYLNPAGQKNVLAVYVGNTGENSRWYSGSGIYRHVWLRVTDPVNIPVWGVAVTTSEVSDEKATVLAEVSVENNGNSSVDITIKNTVFSPGGKEVSNSEKMGTLAIGEKKKIEQLLDVPDPELWSTGTPSLYILKTELLANGNVVDTDETTFGIRSISFSPGNGFLLNGKQVLLQGACIHHDNGPLGAAAFDRADQRRIEILKANGFNAIRTSHNPPSQGFLDACDRLGMLVMDEAFDMWEIPKRKDDYHQFFKKWHEKDLCSMILRDRNHPSVIIWSIGNEIRERADTSGIRIAKDLIRIIKEIDQTRPVTNAICGFWETKGRKWEESAPAFALLDVCGYNYAYEEYEKDHTQYPERIIVGTESFPMSIYENWKMAHEKPYVIGDFVWTGMDYLGEAGIGQAMVDSTTMCWPWINANCGDIDLIGYKKPQAYYRDVVWDRSQLEMEVEEIAPEGKEWKIRAWGWRRTFRSWSWPGNEGKNMNVYVYTKCEEVRMELNGQVIVTQKATPASKFTYVFSIPYEPGELKAVAVSGGKEVAVKSLKTTGPVEKIKIIPERPFVTADRNDLVYLSIELADTNGNRVFNQEVAIHFSVEGEAEMIGVDNGNPMEPKSFRAGRCKTYLGRCLVILRPTGKIGKLKITAASDQISAASCQMEIK
ncbi:MAG: glycoside hydrolase family 2 TIM barrel-domain containing protein [Mangrovibacterium sp.]